MVEIGGEVGELLAKYPDSVRDLALEAREFILASVPGLDELPDRSANVIGYGFGSGYTDMICTLILSKGGVKLGIVRSAELPDPKGLLEGTGKVHRYVALNSPADLKKSGLKQLMKAAVSAWKLRSNGRK